MAAILYTPTQIYDLLAAVQEPQDVTEITDYIRDNAEQYSDLDLILFGTAINMLRQIFA